MACFCTGGCGNLGCYCRCRCQCHGHHCSICGAWVGNYQYHNCRPVVAPWGPYHPPYIRPNPWRRDPHWRGDIICKALGAARSIK